MAKTILSFDVGIVNLAYCIISKKEDNKFDILKWDIINIDMNKIVCSHKGKKVKVNSKTNTIDICGKNAKYASYNEHICSAHYTAYMKNFNKSFDNNHPIVKINLEDGIKCSVNKCKCFTEYSHNNTYYCTNHYMKLKKEYIANNTPKKIKSQNSNYKSINNLSNHLFNKLDELKNDFLQVDEVLIENQPSLINPTMKTISALLYSYFTIRGKIDREINNSKITSVYFISPQNKLKINKDTTDKALNKENNLKKREEYILTKDLGKKYCRSLVEYEKKYIEILDSHKKSDDLCDSFLQGFYYLFYKDCDFPTEYKKILDIVSEEYEKAVIEKEKKKCIKNLKK
jgi:hypothetical protein